MLKKKDTEDNDLRLLKEYLPKLDKAKRAYLKGVTEALFYAQEALPAIPDNVEQDEKRDAR